MEFEYENKNNIEFSLDDGKSDVKMYISPETKQYIQEAKKNYPGIDNPNIDLKAFAMEQARQNSQEIKDGAIEIVAKRVTEINNNPELDPLQKLGELKNLRKPSATFATGGEDAVANLLLPVAQARKVTLGISQNIENVFNFFKTQYGYEPSDTEKKAILENNRFIDEALTAAGYRPKFAEIDIMNSDDFQSKYGTLTREEQFNIAKKEADDNVPFFNPTIFGDLVVYGAAIPAKFAASVSGGISYLMSIGSGKSQLEGTTTGLVTAGATKGLEYLIRAIGNKDFITNIFTGKATVGQTYDYLIRETGTTPKQIGEYTNNYAKAIGKNVNDLTTVEKIDAILQNSPVAGKYKAAADFWSGDVINTQIANEETLKELFENQLMNGIVSRNDFIDASNSAKSLYSDMRDLIVSKFDTNNIRINPSKIEQVIKNLESVSALQTKTDITKVISRLQESINNPTSLDNLIVLKHDLNRLNLSDMGKIQRKEVTGLIDDAIKSTMKESPDYELGKELWKDINNRYAVMKIAQDPENSLGKILLKYADKRISPDDIAKDILSLGQRGAANFNEIHGLLGEEKTAVLEKAIIKEALNNKNNMAQAFDYIKGFEFASQEGRDFVKEVERLKGIVPDEDAIRILGKVGTGEYKTQVGWSDNIIAKIKIRVVQKVWSEMMSRLPEAEGERAFRTLGDIIKSTDYKNVKLDIKSDPELQQLFLNEQKSVQAKIEELTAQKSSKDLRKELLSDLNKQLFGLVQREKELTSIIDKNAITQDKINKLSTGSLFPPIKPQDTTTILPKQIPNTVFGNEIPPAEEALKYIAGIKDPARQAEAYTEYFSKTQGQTKTTSELLGTKFNSLFEKYKAIENEILAKEDFIKTLEKQPQNEFLITKINEAKKDITTLENELGASGTTRLVPSTKTLPIIKPPKVELSSQTKKITESQAAINNEVTNKIKVLQENIAQAGKQIESYYKGNLSKAKKAEFASQKSAEIRAMYEQIKELEKKRPKLTKELP